jgi:hypothetical protein
MSAHKGSEFFPIGDLMTMPPPLDRLRLNRSSGSFELKPLVDGIAANPEAFTRFAAFHSIEVDRFHHFAAQVSIVSFRHWAKSAVDILLMIVLTSVAVAIDLCRNI